MHETPEELAALQTLLDTSRAGASDHLRGIIGDDRAATAADLVGALTGMQVLVVATSTADGRPITSAVDGHFVHGRWVFTTAGDAVKAHHMAARPDVSATHLRGEALGVFTHGTAVRLTPEHPDFAGVDAHLTAHYGSAPSAWGPDIHYLRLEPRWMVAYAADLAALRLANAAAAAAS